LRPEWHESVRLDNASGVLVRQEMSVWSLTLSLAGESGQAIAFESDDFARLAGKEMVAIYALAVPFAAEQISSILLSVGWEVRRSGAEWACVLIGERVGVSASDLRPRAANCSVVSLRVGAENMKRVVDGVLGMEMPFIRDHLLEGLTDRGDWICIPLGNYERPSEDPSMYLKIVCRVLRKSVDGARAGGG
jgi:hypothetical protein